MYIFVISQQKNKACHKANNNFSESPVIMQQAQSKKLYENALCTTQSSQSLLKALNSVLRLAFSDHTHFNFLLHNINWFNEPYLQHINILQKSLRIYRGKAKQAEKVVYNILADGMWSSSAWKKASECLINITKLGYDGKILRESLRQNYPHKISDFQMHRNYINGLLYLYKNLNGMKFQIIEIIVLELASFDTELCTDVQNYQQILPSDSTIKRSRSKLVEDSNHAKFDQIITHLLKELEDISKQTDILKELFVIFKNDLILIERTTYVQYLVYFFAEKSKKASKEFAVLMLGEISDQLKNKQNKKTLTSLSNYLASYLSKSNSLSSSFINRTFDNLICISNELLADLEVKNIDKSKRIEQIDLRKVYEDNFDLLMLLQTIIWIWIIRKDSLFNSQSKLRVLLENSEQLCWFKYFINKKLLKDSQLFHQKQIIQNYKCIEIENKFTPVFLKEFGYIIEQVSKPYQKIEPHLKVQNVKVQVKEQSLHFGMPKKRVKLAKIQTDQGQFL